MKNILIILLPTTLLFSCSCQHAPSKHPDHIIQSFPENGNNSRIISWRSGKLFKPGYAQLTATTATHKEFSLTDSALSQKEIKLRIGNSAAYHSVEFNNLPPNKNYIYRVGDGKNWSEWIQFSTPDDNPNSFSFLYYGDAQNKIKEYCTRNFKKSIQQFPDIDFTLHAGDLINNANLNSQWHEWFEAGEDIFTAYPTILAAGNHEYHYALFNLRHKEISKYWHPQFTLPENGPENHKENAYYVDYKNARIIVLDTYSMILKEESALAQSKWLEEVLKSNTKKWLIVTHHHPIARLKKSQQGKFTDEVLNYLKPLYDKYGVDIVLQGHDHGYARGSFPVKDSVPARPIYTVSVAGPKMYTPAENIFYKKVVSNMQLFQHIEVNGSTMHYTSYNLAGEAIDKFSITKE